MRVDSLELSAKKWKSLKRTETILSKGEHNNLSNKRTGYLIVETAGDFVWLSFHAVGIFISAMFATFLVTQTIFFTQQQNRTQTVEIFYISTIKIMRTSWKGLICNNFNFFQIHKSELVTITKRVWQVLSPQS